MRVTKYIESFDGGGELRDKMSVNVIKISTKIILLLFLSKLEKFHFVSTVYSLKIITYIAVINLGCCRIFEQKF